MTLELPFAYEEHGKRKEALVKVVLCSKCVRKVMWKRKHEKRRREDDGVEGKMEASDMVEVLEDRKPLKSRSRSKEVELNDDSKRHGARRRRSSRSQSPR
jgi:protein FRA10AC1